MGMEEVSQGGGRLLVKADLARDGKDDYTG
jgi:hypothetical protein